MLSQHVYPFLGDTNYSLCRCFLLVLVSEVYHISEILPCPLFADSKKNAPGKVPVTECSLVVVEDAVRKELHQI